MKHLLNKGNRTVKVTFLGETIEVRKLTVGQVEAFQKKVKSAGEDDGLDIQRQIIRLGVVGAEDMTDEELNSFPLDDLSSLATEILQFVGVKSDSKPGN
jgi:hypothetical protein